MHIHNCPECKKDWSCEHEACNYPGRCFECVWGAPKDLVVEELKKTKGMDKDVEEQLAREKENDEKPHKEKRRHGLKSV